MKSSIKSIALAGGAALAVFAVSTVHAATTGFNQTGAGPYDYNTAGNWVSSTINGLWDTSLTLTSAQTNTFAIDTVLTTGLTFNYAGAFPLTLMATNPGTVNLTLAGDISMSTTTNGNAANVTIGDATNHVNINLGGVTRTITVASNVLVLNDVVSNGGMTKAGAGNLKLQGTNTYDGVTTINAGSVAIRTGNALGSTVGNTAITANGGQLQLQNNIICPEPITVTGGNSTSPFLVPITSSSGSNTLTGSVTLNAAANSLTAFSVGANAWLNLNGAVTRDSAGALNMNVANGSTIVVNNTINNQAGNFTIKGPLASGQTGVVRWNVSGHNFGTLQVRDCGTILLGANDAFATSSSLTVGVSGGGANTDVGTFDLGGYNQTLGTLNLSRGGNATQTIDAFRMVTNSGSSLSTLTVGSGGGSVFGVIVDGANAKVALTKTNSSGTLTLRSINTYTGPTIIAGGTLTLGLGTTNAAGANVFGSLSSGTSLFINSNATLDVSALATNAGTYTFTPASLTASGLGSNGQARIVGSVGGTVDLTNKPISFVWSGPSSGTNNGLYAMNVVSSTLNLSSNQFTVVVPGAALTDGQYQLLFAPNITGSVNPTPLYAGGNGVATNYTGKINLVGTNNIYLIVTLNTYTVTYATNNATSGTAPTDSNTYTNGQMVTVLANTGGLTRPGYTFAGWNTASDGSGTSYAASGSAIFTMGPANVKLWPVWTAAVTSPAYITNSIISGNQLVLNWPTGQGWVLQSNSVSLTDTNSWFPLTGATPPFTNNINPALPKVFYRLKN
jgi:uncharacterized repeat protein (TIGR02543 family)